MKLHPFTQTEPINYCAEDTMKHLYFKDYKHLKDVDWGIDKSIVIDDIIGLLGFIIAVLSIIVILFLGV